MVTCIIYDVNGKVQCVPSDMITYIVDYIKYNVY